MSERQSADRIARARRLVMEHGWNATCYQIINPGITLWFSRDDDAVVGFVPSHRVRVVAGAPVCASARLAAVVEEFESDARARGFSVCYFGAEQRLEALLHGDDRYSALMLGAQPVWDPQRWHVTATSRASLRAQLNRARNKSVVVEEWDVETVRSEPRIEALLHAWLATRGLPPMHFLVEPDTLARLFDRRIFVATRQRDVVGFAVASPVPRREGWLVEQIVRAPWSPNGTTELLVDAIARAIASDGARYMTLGLSPLSTRVGSEAATARWLAVLLRWLRAHGRRFYNFEGLDQFKAKFAPERWDHVYAISSEARFSARALYAIASAFSGGSPALLIVRAMIRSRPHHVSGFRRRRR